jgi:hypothetical protein
VYEDSCWKPTERRRTEEMSRRIVILIALSALLVAIFAAPALAAISEVQDQTVVSPNSPVVILSSPDVAAEPM